MKVLVGMSGGVDSSMTAWMLKEAGYETEGLSLVLFETRTAKGPTACCSRESVEDAARTAAHIGIPHGTVDVRGDFISHVIEPFIESYGQGRTPNPCILCNQHIKFPVLLTEAERRGADFIATGHSARVERDDEGGVTLKKGVDPNKDQSYVLYVLGNDTLKKLFLPLGSLTKDEVRARARELKLPACERPESQEICFVEQRDYAGFISPFIEAGEPGPIVDKDGKRVGEHKGIHHYTVGQRRGLGISSASPLYVTMIDPKANAVHVGPREAAMKRLFYASDLNWLQRPEGAFKAGVRVRSMMREMPAEVAPVAGGRVRVEFEKPQWAPAPGQAVVFYDEDIVLGGGVIE